MDERPKVRCLVAKQLPNGEYIVRPRAPMFADITLDDAVEYAKLGWEVMPDPFDQAELVRWEQLNRSTRYKRW